jgi:hypothetical protein
MNTPILLISGAAGSGKDALASAIAKHVPAALVAQADPLKRFGKLVFGFTEHALWGPSEARNAVDPSYDTRNAWTTAGYNLGERGIDWLADALGVDSQSDEFRAAWAALTNWFVDLKAVHDPDRPDRRQLTPRYVLQTLGTEWGRTVKPTIWNDYAIRTAKTLLHGGHYYNKIYGAVAIGDVGGSGPEVVVLTDGRFKNEIIGVHAVGGASIRVSSPIPAPNAEVEAAGVASHKSETELRGIPSWWYTYHVVNDKTLGLEALEAKAKRLVAHFTGLGPSIPADFGQAQ